MASQEDFYATPGPLSTFPAPGLRDIQRHITTHNEAGVGVFLPIDNGDHHSNMANGRAISNIIYNQSGLPVDLNGEADVKYAAADAPGLMEEDGSLVRIIDFAPGVESNAHRALTIGYGCVIEGEFQLELDSGEKRTMKPGDCSINRATVHTWRNMLPDKPGRIIYVLLPIKPLYVNGQRVTEAMGALAASYPQDEKKKTERAKMEAEAAKTNGTAATNGTAEVKGEEKGGLLGWLRRLFGAK